jgi:hypothetical protein
MDYVFFTRSFCGLLYKLLAKLFYTVHIESAKDSVGNVSVIDRRVSKSTKNDLIVLFQLEQF